MSTAATREKTIVVEARTDPRCQPLDALAGACRSLGYRVIRWQGPFAWRFKYFASRMPPCNAAIVWNGTHHRYSRTMRCLRKRHTPCLFVELGWYPQGDTFQIDPAGINAAASWVGEPLVGPPQPRLPLPDGDDLLVVLQYDGDTQLSHYSPRFPNMLRFLDHLIRHARLPLRVRPHPRHPPSRAVRRLLRCSDCTIDESASLHEAIGHCRALACVNSSAALEAMSHRVPVLCYGQAIYRYEGAVYCMEGVPNQTREVTRALADGACDLSQPRVEEVLARVNRAQWRLADLPTRLSTLLQSHLS